MNGRTKKHSLAAYYFPNLNFTAVFNPNRYNPSLMKTRWLIFCGLTLFTLFRVIAIATAQTETGGADARTPLYSDIRTTSQYIVGEPHHWQAPLANQSDEALSNLTLTFDFPPQFNLTRLQSGWYGTAEQWSVPTTIVVRYQTSEDGTTDPWRLWTTWQQVIHRRWGLAFVSDLDLPAGVVVTRVRYEFGDVPPQFHWGNGRDGLPQAEGGVTAFGWNGQSVFEGEEIAGCSTASASTLSGRVVRQTACTTSLRIPTTTNIGLWQYPVEQLADDVQYEAGEIVDIEIGLRHQADSTADLLDPVLASILPAGLNYLPNSWSFVDDEPLLLGGEPISDTAAFRPPFTPPRPLFTAESQPDGSTILRWVWRDVSALSLPYEFAGDNPAVRIRFQAQLSETLTTAQLPLAAHLTTESPEFTCWGEPSRRRDSADLDRDGRLGEPICTWESELITSYQPLLSRVEDELGQRDYGDAAESHGIASHLITPTLRLGLLTDGETAPVPSLFADGDDLHGRDDEEGLIWGNDGIGVPGRPHNRITVVTLNRSDQLHYLSGWIDIDGNGRFDTPQEQILHSYPISPRSNPQAPVITFGLPEDAFCGDVTARFRLGEAGLSPDGAEGVGEVEDISYTIQCEADLVLDVQPVYPVVGKGETMRWNLTLTNTGPSLAHQVVISNTILDGLAYANHRVNPTVGWRCTTIRQIEETRQQACTLPQLAAGDVVTMQVAIRVPILFPGVSVPHIAQAESQTLERDRSRNFIQAQVPIEKSWQALPIRPEDLFFFAHVRFHDAFVTNRQFQEQDFYLNELVTNPIQLPLEVALGVNSQQPPYLTVPSCIGHLSDPTCNNNNFIEGTLVMDGYTFNEVVFVGEPIYTFEKPIVEEAPDPTYLRLSRIVDSRMSLCAGRGSCMGFDLFRLDADGRAPYAWEAPADYFYFNFITKGGREIVCPEVYDGRCALINDARPGVYELRGSVNLLLHFQDVRLGDEPINLHLEPIDVVVFVKVVAPFIEPEG